MMLISTEYIIMLTIKNKPVYKGKSFIEQPSDLSKTNISTTIDPYSRLLSTNNYTSKNDSSISMRRYMQLSREAIPKSKIKISLETTKQE